MFFVLVFCFAFCFLHHLTLILKVLLRRNNNKFSFACITIKIFPLTSLNVFEHEHKEIIHAIYGMLHERRQSAAASCNSTGSFSLLYELTGHINTYMNTGFIVNNINILLIIFFFQSFFIIQYRKCIYIIYCDRIACFSSNNGIANKKKLISRLLMHFTKTPYKKNK